MHAYDSILDAIGNTPLVRLNKVVPPGAATVYAKCEFMNPAGSIKDRMAWHIIRRAEEEGLLKPGGTIVENTSGNTGAGAAMAAAALGYRAVFTMPDKMSQEKIDALRAFGSEVIITPTDVPGDSPEHYVNRAKAVAAETPNAFYMDQYHNQWNIEAHEQSTGPELFEQTDGGKVDAIVVGTGTGGTISGIGRYFKRMQKDSDHTTLIVGVDPLGSVHYSIFNTGEPSTPYVYKVEGLGEDIVCQAFDPSVVDEMHQVSDYECFSMARRLIREEGLYCGGSSGGMAYVAIEVAKRLGEGKSVIAICPDSAGRYITKYLRDDWMKMHGFLEKPRGLGVVGDLIQNEAAVVTVHEDKPLRDVIDLMRRHGISQVPVTDDQGKPLGMVHEIDILRGLQKDAVTTDSPVRDIETQIGGILSPSARVEELYGVFGEQQAAIVVNEGRIIGVLSEIDLIEHLARVGGAGSNGVASGMQQAGV
ncbi:MAG: pyridoxal-phosphate dependent enzyme [Phycisphaerales bacterium]|jgi:cystathionine beta-synthase